MLMEISGMDRDSWGSCAVGLVVGASVSSTFQSQSSLDGTDMLMEISGMDRDSWGSCAVWLVVGASVSSTFQSQSSLDGTDMLVEISGMDRESWGSWAVGLIVGESVSWTTQVQSSEDDGRDILMDNMGMDNDWESSSSVGVSDDNSCAVGLGDGAFVSSTQSSLIGNELLREISGIESDISIWVGLLVGNVVSSITQLQSSSEGIEMLVDSSGMLNVGGTSVEFSCTGALVGVAVVGWLVTGASVSSVVQSQSSVGKLSINSLGSGDGLGVISSVPPNKSSVETDMLEDKSSSGREREDIISLIESEERLDGADISCDDDSVTCKDFVVIISWLLEANAHSS